MSETDLLALGLTLKLATGVTLVLIALSLPLSFFLAHWQSRWKLLAEALTTLPLVLPPTVLGYYLLVAFAPDQFLGQSFHFLFDQQLAFSFAGIFIASLIYSLPFALRPLQAAFEQQGRGLMETSALLGMNPTQTFFRVLLPNISPALLSAASLTFAHTMGEFGVILMIGGNIPGETQVLSVALFEHVETLQYQQANQLALTMLGLSLLVVIFSQWLGKRHA
ncbi:MAG: molybdate ABC transporter permease subunit [Candidatus Pelagadaptatus aseana]|uniref:molybdate ABC transporter permease subunit n=1 Tax=Candidatus Pelagadaptatus aseana TaxID=3120508 RepID=UPI0039B1804D